MYQVIFSPLARKFFRKLDKHSKERIVSALKRIRVRPYSYLKRLVGDSAYKFRVGDYRLLIEINNGKLVLLVIKIGHRKNIYKQ